MRDIGRLLIVVGVLAVVLGTALPFADRMGGSLH